MDRDSELAAPGLTPITAIRSDRLVEVQRRPTKTPALLLIESQSQRDTTFNRRLFDYAYRISGRLNLPRGVLIILTDRDRSADRLLLTMLQRRCGPLGAAEAAAVERLDGTQRQRLAEALFDLHSLEDLQAWLAEQPD